MFSVSATMLAAWLIAGLVGELASWLLVVTDAPDSLGWWIYAAALVTAAIPTLIAWRWRRSGSLHPAWQRWALAVGIPACAYGVATASTPDWNPVPFLVAFVVCCSLGITAWILSRIAPREYAVEQRHRADGVR